MLDLGCVVVCIDNNNHELYKLKSELKLKNNRLYKSRIFFYCIDITCIDQIKQTAIKIKNEVGSVDIVINNAGVMNHGKLFLQLTEEEITRLFNVNIFSQFWLCKQFLPDMVKSNKGHIVNVASVCGLMGGYKLTDYCSSKFAVVGFTESLRVELKCINPDNSIVVSTVCPFHVKTKLFNGIEFNHLKWLGLSMDPEYVAKKIVDGILANKELILVPSFTTSIFLALRK
jgi:all-trans-retinol dehydrogenase (NAD+)